MHHALCKDESQIWCHALILGIRTDDREDEVILGLLFEEDDSTADNSKIYNRKWDNYKCYQNNNLEGEDPVLFWR